MYGENKSGCERLKSERQKRKVYKRGLSEQMKDQERYVNGKRQNKGKEKANYSINLR